MPIPFPREAASSTSRPPPPSYPPTESDFNDEEEAAMIQEEWEESLRQLETVISIIIIPYFCKWMGRRWAYWGERRHGFHRRPC